MPPEHFDVLIVGAGLSGVGAACRLRARCPGKTFSLLEARDAIGGTWDLFRYPGVRSDSDMHTLGYRFRPWPGAAAIADGPAILAYVRDTARESGVDRDVRFGHRVVAAEWSSTDAAWTVEAEVGTGPDAGRARFTCGFLYLCTGYYDYDRGHAPDWPGTERFAGRIVHPQHWPAGLGHAGERVVVIGSGATAVTLVPALARTAAHVTMLQRSPTYVVARPSRDGLAGALRRVLPGRLARRLTRWKNVLVGAAFYRLCRRRPGLARRLLLAGVRRQLGADFDVEAHFSPRYAPWDQRLCVAPDGDLFEAIRSGRASVVTDEIESFAETGVRLRSGRLLEADLVVTATGLTLRLAGGARLSVDGAEVDLASTTAYKGAMLGGVPNLALAFGYVNASWTLRCELTADYVCRLLNFMAARGYAACVPRRPAGGGRPLLDFTSGYVRRAAGSLPRQGAGRPWRVRQNYPLDFLETTFGRVDDGVLEFSRAPAGAATPAAEGRP